MMPFKVRLILMGLAGFALGALLTRLPWWATAAVLIGGVVWAGWMFVHVEQDLRRIRRDLAVLEAEIRGAGLD